MPARIKQTRRPPMSLHFIHRIAKELKEVRAKFNGHCCNDTRIVIKKFSSPGRMVWHRKNNKKCVKHTEIYLELPSTYPLNKPRLFFTDSDVVQSRIADTGQYMDKVKWRSGLTLCEYIDCVRHEILASPN